MEPDLNRSRIMNGVDSAHVARRNAADVSARLAAIPAAPPKAADEYWDWYNKHHATLQLIEEVAATAVIFSCATAEFYINEFAGRLLGDTYFQAHIDRLDLASKWVVAPRLAVGHRLDRGGRAYELLRRMIAARNDLVHPKMWDFSPERAMRMHLQPDWSEHSRDAIQALDLLRVEAMTFDPLPERAHWTFVGSTRHDKPE
jgi:hypothetical protein